MDLQEYYKAREVIKELIECQIPHSGNCEKVMRMASWRSAVACDCGSNEVRSKIIDLAKIIGVCEIE